MGGVNKPGKPKSKRQPVRLRHKIEKASAAKQKKARKLAKKNPEWRSKLKKDPGIPNLFPFKDKILAEIEDARRRKSEEAQRRKADAKAAKSDAKSRENGDGESEVRMEGIEQEDTDEDMNDDVDEGNPMAALLASARAAAREFNEEPESGDEMDEDSTSECESVTTGATAEIQGLSVQKDGSRKAFDKIFKQVVDQADVILYVLDARDPEGTRSKEVERMVMAAQSGEKRLILILNKIDLVPPPVLKSWLAYLRRYFPSLPFRASNPAPNACTFKHKELTIQSTSTSLFKALKSYAAAKQLKRSISVGVIGYPNVGKSSVINALTSHLGRAGGACPVGAEAGVTTSLRQVKIDSKLKLLDSPGIVFPSSNVRGQVSKEDQQARLVLLNAVPPKMIEDPVSAVTLLLKRLSASKELFAKLLELYDLPPLLTKNGDPTMDFLVQTARRRGRLGKGGVPNINSAAMTVITDWRDGRIQGWVEAPNLALSKSLTGGDSQKDAICDEKKIVKEWAAEFKLEGLWEDELSKEPEESSEAMQT